MGLALFLAHLCIVAILITAPYAKKEKEQQVKEKLKKPKIERSLEDCPGLNGPTNPF